MFRSYQHLVGNAPLGSLAAPLQGRVESAGRLPSRSSLTISQLFQWQGPPPGALTGLPPCLHGSPQGRPPASRLLAMRLCMPCQEKHTLTAATLTRSCHRSAALRQGPSSKLCAAAAAADVSCKGEAAGSGGAAGPQGQGARKGPVGCPDWNAGAAGPADAGTCQAQLQRQPVSCR